MKIPFNVPFLTGREEAYIIDVLHLSANSLAGNYAEKCKYLLKEKWDYKNIQLTSSCTSALEICALLLDIIPGDEVIVPSYTFPTTASAFLRQGAKIRLADSRKDSPGIDENSIEALVNEKTKAIVVVHYGGISCDMDKIMNIAEKHCIKVIEDAALAFDSFFKSLPLGSIGHFGCLSFHQTKNLQCGEGGALVINDDKFNNRALNILEKGTNRNEFISGTVKRYEWVEVGSSYLMSELHAAYLFAQLNSAEWIKERRLTLWNLYDKSLRILEEKGMLNLPSVPDYADHNAHTYYIVLKTQNSLTDLKEFLKIMNIETSVHYTSLDKSLLWKRSHTDNKDNVNSNRYNDCLLRLPLFNSMTEKEVLFVADSILKFFNVRS